MTAQLPPPDIAAALVTAGALCHFVASAPDLTDRFAAWASHCPGDLDAATVLWYLAHVHELVAPTCADRIGATPRPVPT